MSAREIAKEQPKSFQFSAENLRRAKAIIAKYPSGRQQSAVMPLLDLAQRQIGDEEGSAGWVPIAAMEVIADMLEMPYIRVYEVATFYTMYNLRPVGKYLVQVCRTTPCWLRGSDAITDACRDKLKVELGGTSKDKKFTLVEVECLGACVNAPMAQVNDDYYEDLTPEIMDRVLADLAAGRKVPVGSQAGRRGSAPQANVPAATSAHGKLAKPGRKKKA